MFLQSDRKAMNRQFQEAATQRKAANDTQYFWDLVNRNMNGNVAQNQNRKTNSYQEEKILFGKSAEHDKAGSIDDNIPVQRSGPMSQEVPVLESFEDLNGKVPSCVLRCFERLKFDQPTPIQKHAVPLGLAGLDLMCCAQTGSGKTFAFLVPLVALLDGAATSVLRQESGSLSPSDVPVEESSKASFNTTNASTSDDLVEDPAPRIDQRGSLVRAVILAPTRELASQIHLDARRLTFGSSLRCVCVYGGNDIRAQLVELSQGCDIVIATPGRLNDLVDRGVICLANVTNLVLDEGDRMLDMGFEPQIRRIVLEYDMPQTDCRQTFLFSATFPTEIQALAREFLREYVWIAVGRVGSTVDNIKQQILMTSSDPNEKIRLLLSVLDHTSGRTLLFVQKRKTASWLCECLRNMYGVAAEEIHGDRSQAQRENALKSFRDGAIRILVATDVAARGLDVPAVTHVVQFDMPISPEDFDVYVHRIGRTGRAGMAGLATSFFVPGREVGEGNGRITAQLLQMLRESKQEVPEWLSSMSDSRDYSGARSAGQQRRYGYNRDGPSQSGGRFGYHDYRSQHNSVVYQSSSHGERSDNYPISADRRQQTYARSSVQHQHQQPVISTSYQQAVVPPVSSGNHAYSQYSPSQSSMIVPTAAPAVPMHAHVYQQHMQSPMAVPQPIASYSGYYDPYTVGYAPAYDMSSPYGTMAALQHAPSQQGWVVHGSPQMHVPAASYQMDMDRRRMNLMMTQQQSAGYDAAAMQRGYTSQSMQHVHGGAVPQGYHQVQINSTMSYGHQNQNEYASPLNPQQQQQQQQQPQQYYPGMRARHPNVSAVSSHESTAGQEAGHAQESSAPYEEGGSAELE